MAKKKKKRHIFLKTILGLFCFSIALLAFFAYKIAKLDAWHEFDAQKILGADESLIIYDSETNEICTLHADENRISIPLSDVPDIVQKAFIATEDARFYEHNGIDIIRIFGAAFNDLKSGSLSQGASTITQQLIKLSHLSPEKTIQRKTEEAILAYTAEQQFSKDRILEMYLNYVYFGGGYYGIEAASRGYFGIHASELSAAQGAVLAGILKSPSKYSPHINYDKSMGRHEVVLSLMHDYGYLSDEEYSQALDEKIELKKSVNNERSYYTDYAINQACDILDISSDELMRGGYRICTSRDTYIQDICDSIYADDDFFPNNEVQSAICVVNCDTGYIEAMVGGRGTYKAASFNRACDIRRQPGSVIKPILVYAPALEYYGYTAATVLDDSPRSFGNYTPKNSGSKYYGHVTLRKAITSSLNIPAVSVLEDIGVENGKRFAEKTGIEFTENDTSLALALGGFTYGISPLQAANAYGAICDGLYTKPSAIISITDKYGNILYTHNIRKTRVLSDANAYILTDMLCSVTEDGTAHRLGDTGLEIASKTGTVSESDDKNRDAWITAYTNEHSVSVWIGYDSASDGSMKSSVTGGTYPAKIAGELFSKIYTDEKPHFDMPESVLRLRIDSKSISDSVPTLASAMTPMDSSFYEYFAEGTQPTETSSYWGVPSAPIDFKCISTDEVITFTFTAFNNYTDYVLWRKTGDITTNIGTYNGEANSLIICTDNKPENKESEYFIVPVHKELSVNGMPVTGPESLHITVVQE